LRQVIFCRTFESVYTSLSPDFVVVVIVVVVVVVPPPSLAGLPVTMTIRTTDSPPTQIHSRSPSLSEDSPPKDA